MLKRVVEVEGRKAIRNERGSITELGYWVSVTRVMVFGLTIYRHERIK